MKNVIKSFLFLAIGFALGAFTMKTVGEQEVVRDAGFTPITKTQSTSRPSNSAGFTPIQKEQATTTGFKPISASSREQALLEENRQLKEKIRYLEGQLTR